MMVVQQAKNVCLPYHKNSEKKHNLTKSDK